MKRYIWKAKNLIFGIVCDQRPAVNPRPPFGMKDRECRKVARGGDQLFSNRGGEAIGCWHRVSMCLSSLTFVFHMHIVACMTLHHIVPSRPASPLLARARSIIACKPTSDLATGVADASDKEQAQLSQGAANAMFDTVGALDRPQLWETLEKQDALTIAFLAHGMLVSGANIAGFYDAYETWAIGCAAILGLSSAVWGLGLLATGGIPDDTRPGFAHERAIMLYTSSYLAGVMWLCLRFSPLYPASDPTIVALDPALCLASIAVYIYGMVSPIFTSLALDDELTPTERLRMRGMVASGLVGAVFILNTAALLFNGPEWWVKVVSVYPAQSVLEPSTALFAAYAVEAGMLIHRLARRGVVTFAQAVPFYGVVVLPVLTLLPMGCLFWWKHEDISFWRFLFDL